MGEEEGQLFFSHVFSAVTNEKQRIIHSFQIESFWESETETEVFMELVHRYSVHVCVATEASGLYRFHVLCSPLELLLIYYKATIL